MFKVNGKEMSKVELIELLESGSCVDLKISSNKETKKKPMEKLNYRFPDFVKSECSELAVLISEENKTMSESDIARIAMFHGLNKIREIHESNSNTYGMLWSSKLKMIFK